MLTQEDKKWIVDVLVRERVLTTQQFAEMREFIIEGRRQDRIWTDNRIEYAVDDLARTVAVGFDEVHTHLKKIEHPQTVGLF